MPTRLGNVLRRYERLAGQPYGLEAIGAASILAQVAPKVVRDYYDDMRTDMDQATSLVAAWTFVAGSSFFLLWRHGPWLIVPALATLLAYGSYRSAVAAAEGFGEALMALVSLGRWSLYDALHVELPPDSTVERDTNALLNSQLSGDWVKIRYRVSGERAVPVQEQAETPGLEE